MVEIPKACRNCTYYVNSVDGTGICSCPREMRLLRVKETHLCPKWHPTIAASLKAERDLATEARAIANKLMGN